MPPAAVTVAAPLLASGHTTLVMFVTEASSGVGSVMVVVEDTTHPAASVTITVYVPAAKLGAVAVVAPLDQLYITGKVAPVGMAVACPLFPPAHETLEAEIVVAKAQLNALTVTVCAAVQLLPSATVTVYAPGARPVMVWVLCPLLQL